MAFSAKYGKVNIPRIADDEPVFILRAQDKLAPSAIEMYKVIAASHDSKVVGSIGSDLDNFKKWQGKRKLPD